MTNILTLFSAVFSTRTLLQIIFVLGAALAMKAWSLGSHSGLTWGARCAVDQMKWTRLQM